MTKQQAKELIDKLLDSRLLDPDIAKDLQCLKNTICHGDFPPCTKDNHCRFCDEFVSNTHQF